MFTFAVAEILRGYGAPYDAMGHWGGSVVYGGPTHIGGLLMRDGRADALFHEAQMSPVWGAIAAARKVHILPIRDDVRDYMLRKYGFERAEIPAGHLSGAIDPTATVDLSGWLLLCRDDLPDEWAYAAARACDETRRGVEDDQAGRGEIEIPIDSRYLFNRTVIPLHAGARAYAEEKGVYPRERQ